MERIIERPVEIEIYVYKDKIVESTIEKVVTVEVLVEKIVKVPVERMVYVVRAQSLSVPFATSLALTYAMHLTHWCQPTLQLSLARAHPLSSSRTQSILPLHILDCAVPSDYTSHVPRQQLSPPSLPRPPSRPKKACFLGPRTARLPHQYRTHRRRPLQQ